MTIAILALLMLLAVRFDHVVTQNLEGHVTVNDGDTITLGAERIRLRGIDAPEYSQKCARNGNDYACGRRSREELITLIGGRSVTCSASERDKYGRLLAICSVGGVDLNRRQVETGWAVAYGAYHSEEETARRGRLGLWEGSFDNPRDWRDAHGGMAEIEHNDTRFLEWLRGIFRFF